MKKVISIILILTAIFALASCGEKKQDTPPAPPPVADTAPADNNQPAKTPDAQPNEPANTPDAQPNAPIAGPPTLAASAAQRATDAYAFIADLHQKASVYDSSAAKYRYTLNCQDPATSASGEFLYAWSDAVLIATEGAVYIEVGVSNAFCAGGSMAALDDMISGAVDFVFTLPCYFKGYLPLTLCIQNPALGIKNITSGAFAMWDLYKSSPDIQAEFKKNGECMFVWANNPSPLSYKGTEEYTDISQIKGNIRGNNGPAQMFINQIGASVFPCPIGDVYTNVSTGVIDNLITDWHAIYSFSLSDQGVLNHYLDTNIGCSAYTVMANDAVWAKIVKDGYADAIKSVSGDYMLNWVSIWEEYETNSRQTAKSNGGTIYPPSAALAGQLKDAYDSVAKQWVSENGAPAQGIYDKAVEYVNKYNGIYN
jgi:TRAP-type C4-dicarboxylate transport system substrate-binding protein/predicted small lipoprotein YifL